MKTRSLTEGAMLGAITVLLTIIGEYLGVTALLVPVPLMLLVYRQGFRLGILTAVVAALIASLVAGHVFSGLSIIIWGFVGVSLGMALREKFSFPRLIIVGILANLVVMGLNVLLYSLLFGQNLLTEMVTILTTGIEQAMEVWESVGMTGDALARYESILEFAPFILKWGFPALLLIYAIAMAYINLGILRMILKRMGDDSMPWIAPFTQWQIPSYYGIFLVVGMLLTIWAQVTTIPVALQFIGLNLFIIFFHTYLVLGLGIVWHYFKLKNIAKFLRIMFIFLLFSIQSMVLIVAFLGVADGVFDFRKLKTLEEEKK